MRALPTRQYLRFAFSVAVLGLMGWALWRNLSDLDSTVFRFRVGYIVASVLTLAGFYLATIGLWYAITRQLGIALSYSGTAYAWMTSMLGKYLPGKVWVFAARYDHYASAEKNRAAIGVGMLLEFTLFCSSACIIIVVAVLASGHLLAEGLGAESGPVLWGAMVLLAACSAVIHPRLLKGVLRILAKLLGKLAPEEIGLRSSQTYSLLLLAVGVRVIGGFGIFFLVNGVWHLEWQYWLAVTGTMALSGFVGMLAFFAPGGLGVREASIALILSLFMPTGVAIAIGLAARIWMVVTEFLLISAIWLVHTTSGAARVGESP